MISLKLVICLGALCSTAFAVPFLTQKEDALLRENIALIASNLPVHSMNIFIDLFNTRPDFQALFKNFRNTPFHRLRDDPALIRHSQNIVRTLATVVSQNMYDANALYNKFLEVAEHHIPRHVNQDHLGVLKGVVLGYLQKALDGALPPNDLHDLLTAWDKVLTLAFNAFRAVN